MEKKKNNCNGNSVDSTMDKSLNRVANIEAGTDITVQDDALVREAKINDDPINQGVTDYAPYKNIAKYKMVTGEFAEDALGEGADKADIQDNQRS